MAREPAWCCWETLGRAEIGAESYATNLTFSGGEAVGVGIQQLANANALWMLRLRCRAVLAELKKSFPPGMDFAIAVDTTQVVSDSIREVEKTLGCGHHHRDSS